MSFDSFNKENIDKYLKELAKEFRRINGKSAQAELVLVGGAAILTSYNFRNSTMDIDAVFYAASSMKDAINSVGDKYDLPNGWINADFMRTKSYSHKINEFSVYYKTYYGVLSVRTIEAEYLIAMKLCSGRKYKSDYSDIIGILAEHEKRGNPISFDQVQKAVYNLYGGWEYISHEAKNFLEDALKNGKYEYVYLITKRKEKESREILIGFAKDYPTVAKESNVDDILMSLRAKRHQE